LAHFKIFSPKDLPVIIFYAVRKNVKCIIHLYKKEKYRGGNWTIFIAIFQMIKKISHFIIYNKNK